MNVNAVLVGILGADSGEPIDDARSIDWLFPADAELIYGSLASILIFGAIYYFAGPPVKKAMAERSARIERELEQASAATSAAQAEAARIREAAGDIDAERQRLFADADARAETVLSDGRARLEQEIAEMHTRADAEIQASSGRINDELRGEITQLANQATERMMAEGAIDDATHQALIESYISRVGAS